MLDTIIWKILPACLVIGAVVAAATWLGNVSAARSAAEARDESAVILKGIGSAKAQAGYCYYGQKDDGTHAPKNYCAQLAYLIIPVRGDSLSSVAAELHNAMLSQGCVPSDAITDINARFGFYSRIAYSLQSGSGGCYMTYLPSGTADGQAGSGRATPAGLQEALDAAGAEREPLLVSTFFRSYWSPARLIIW